METELETYLTLKVDGFRSLQNAVVPLKQGLNVFVGPNGSGKTNVIAAMEFIATFVEDGVHAAIAKNGGASRVFSYEQLNTRGKNPRITFCLNGRIQVSEKEDSLEFSDDEDEEIEEELVPLEFSYHLSLSLDKSNFEIAIDLEEISWKKLCDSSKTATLSASAVSAERNSSSADISVDRFYRKFMAPQIAEFMIKKQQEDLEGSKIERTFESISKSGKSIMKGTIAYSIDGLSDIRSLLSFKRSFNINPSKVRDPEDIASSKDVEVDGSGTVTKLYRLKAMAGDRKVKSKPRTKPASSYEKIISSFRRVNDQIHGFDVNANLRTGMIDSFVLFGPDKIRLPLHSISDGTVKWLAMLTSIRSGVYSSYCIEEPENYLHPAAQRLFIKTMRDSAKDIKNSFYIISTHSETIVNAIEVDELRICEYESKGTTVRTVKSPEKVQEAINKTGFGLGFLYANQRL